MHTVRLRSSIKRESLRRSSKLVRWLLGKTVLVQKPFAYLMMSSGSSRVDD